MEDIIKPRKSGYLYSLFHDPPLIFRFQFNPETLTEKKSYRYDSNNSGKWDFGGSNIGGLVTTIGTTVGTTVGSFLGLEGGSLLKDAKEIGAQLVNTKPLEPIEGEPRQFSLDFSLDASRGGPTDGDDHYGGSIEPDLAILREFMYPSLSFMETIQMFTSFFKKVPCPHPPPDCTLVYGGLSVTCVMTDLTIKITAFQEDRKPRRADINVTLKEQTFSIDPLLEFVFRHIDIAKSYNRRGLGEDVMAVTPVLNLFE